ncbi:MAG: hypothetical protein AB1553_08980 [Nitrospirota bacterium]
MIVDARGLSHPEHLKLLKKRLEGLCAVDEDVAMLIDNKEKELKMTELYVRTFNCPYTVEKENEHLRVTIKAPFTICGF